MSSYYQGPQTPNRVGANCASILREKIAEYVLKLLVLALLREWRVTFPSRTRRLESLQTQPSHPWLESKIVT